ncbi:hypothetical protein tinsulaeT_29190 [Thalassotalea insulae]|uniref:Cupin type-2 domain-containing protein n=1 Tax=Thalassotalea insulae TaxID=2056778 RepID=A0ABQ6GW66_9GAMM|nr:cupin domain-containing protein [Thalassotalea insulae]GLX79579.1 hypothetical protein tinsulaeT_29190 [Thalassotalea insulae]
MKHQQLNKIYAIILMFAFMPVTLAAQNLNKISAPNNLENIHLVPLGSSDSASEFLIFIKKEVKAHYHQTHTELVYVLAGEADFWLGENKQKISTGDFIRINQGMVHKVVVTSKQPLKILSIQTPKFNGKDRVYTEQ